LLDKEFPGRIFCMLVRLIIMTLTVLIGRLFTISCVHKHSIAVYIGQELLY